MADVLRQIGQFLLPDIGRLVRRFPLPALLTSLVTGYMLLDLHRTWPAPDAFRHTMFLSMGFLASLGSALLLETRTLPNLWRYGLSAAPLLPIALFLAFKREPDTAVAMVSGALWLLIGVAPFLRAAVTADNVWRFNHDLWLGLFAATIGSVLFGLGLSAIVETLRYLFGLIPPWSIHEKIWIVALGLILPLNWCAVVPARFDGTGSERGDGLPSKLVAALIGYVLMPLLVVYAAILHAYAIKILFDGALPKGRLGYMVLAFGAVLVAVGLASFPQRLAGSPMRVFWRIWPWMLPVPVILLGIAVLQRVGQYGLTERRYLLLLAGGWLASLVVTQGIIGGWSAERRDLRLPLSTLAVALLLAAFGPWGVAELPVASQARDFTSRLTAAGKLKDGRVIADVAASGPLLPSDRQRLHATITYLTERRQLDRLRPAFSGVADDPFAPRNASANSTAAADDWRQLQADYVRRQDLAKRIRLRLAIGDADPRGANQRAYFNAGQPLSFETRGATRLVGPTWVNDTQRNAGTLAWIGPGVLGSQPSPPAQITLKTSLQNGRITLIETATGQAAVFDIDGNEAVMSALRNRQTLSPRPGERTDPIPVSRASGDLDASIIVINANGELDATGKMAARGVSFWVLLAR
jgi:Domain of unknown function (DUF4153)